MVSHQVHDDDTDYSDLDEAPASERHAGPKRRERTSERTPLLSTSPPPPAYSDVTRLYGTPPYMVQDSTEPDQDPECATKEAKKHHGYISRKMLLCLVLILAIALTVITTISTTKHDSSHDDQGSGRNRGKNATFPHRTGCIYESISDQQTFTFKSLDRFSFVEITEGSNNPSSKLNGQIRLLLGDDHQIDPILTELRVAKSAEALHQQFRINYSSESLRINTPAYSPLYSKACMELDVTILIKPGSKLEHLEVATEHLDIIIEPGIFPPSEQAGQPGVVDDDFYLSNMTDFIAVSGDVSAAYWQSGRETRIDLTSGSVSGRFALKDVLSVKTRSGDIDISVEPKSASKTDPRPAEFSAVAMSGDVKVVFPVSGADRDLPDRIYRTKVESKSGSLKGDFIHGLDTELHTVSGSIDVNILPYWAATSSGSWVRTDTQSGGTRVNMLAPYKDPDKVIDRLRSVHKTRSGSLHVQYPQQWEGRMDAVSMTGGVKLSGRDIKLLKHWTGPTGAHYLAQKGPDSSSSTMDLGSTTGHVSAIVGDL
jgi:hypothetical protein